MNPLSHSIGVGLFVEDMEKMVAFYRDIMGFETDWDGGLFASFKVNSGSLFMFDRKTFAEAIDRPYYPPNGINLTMGIGIGVPCASDVDEQYERLMALGVKSITGEPVTQPWGQRNFFIADPEGNLVEIGDVG